jgi:Fe-S-cluster containining protein
MSSGALHADPRAEKFSYSCGRCSRCCYHKLIQLNPYEIARLAHRLGQTTSEFSSAWTEDGAGNYLQRTAAGACVFLGEKGCTVHEDRPLVCRLYPLGRHVSRDGTERWSHVTPHPETKGVYGKDATIADYVDAQGARPFMDAADKYAGWVWRAGEVLNRSSAARESGNGQQSEIPDVVDMDGAIDAHCKSNGIEEPKDFEARIQLHLYILDSILADISGDNRE